MTTISATTILSSQHANASDKRVTTLLLRYPRCIHAEFMTHRVFSRNAASSRAIPVEKLIADVEADPFVPLVWGKNQKGMQGGDEHNAPVPDGDRFLSREETWLSAKDQAVGSARAFAEAGYHKQIVNRLLEPFAHITVVVTATEWENFLALRDHPAAEPHIQMLAQEVRRELDKPAMQRLMPGDWHLPFINAEVDVRSAVHAFYGEAPKLVRMEDIHPLLLKLSVARCASTSYKTVDGFDMSLDRAIDLHDKLIDANPMHASPFEHQCMADEMTGIGWWLPSDHGNFDGFRQYRKMLESGALRR